VGFCEYPFDFSCLENEQRRKEEAMAGIGPVSQDWEPVVVRKKAPNASAKKDEKAVNEARRAGGPIETIKKFNAGSNKAATSATGLNTKKLDDETEVLAHERVSADLKKNIMQARLEKKLTQAQLAQVLIGLTLSSVMC
jgi:putative transcription factor